jgi:hypothetical protein
MTEIKEKEPVNQARKAAYRQGVYVILVLALLTASEFFIAQVTGGSLVPLMLGALIKAAIIVYFFMHIYRLWREEMHS